MSGEGGGGGRGRGVRRGAAFCFRAGTRLRAPSRGRFSPLSPSALRGALRVVEKGGRDGRARATCTCRSQVAGGVCTRASKIGKVRRERTPTSASTGGQNRKAEKIKKPRRRAVHAPTRNTSQPLQSPRPWASFAWSPWHLQVRGGGQRQKRSGLHATRMPPPPPADAPRASPAAAAAEKAASPGTLASGQPPIPPSPSRARVLEARLVIQSTAQPPPSRLSPPLFSPWTDTGRRDSRLSPLRPLSPPPLLPPQGMPPSRRRGVTAVALMAVAAGMVEAGCPFGEKRTGQGERETPATAPLHLSRALSLTSLSPSLSLPSSRPRPARHPGLLLGPLPLRRRLPLPPGGLPLLRARPHGGALRRPRAPL